MQSPHRIISVLCLFVMLLLSGCYSHQPYGYGGYPGGYTMPPGQVLPPGGTYMPQGGAAPGGVYSSPQPALGAPTDQWQSPSPTPATDPNGSPLYGNPPGTFAPNNNDNLVPNYPDPANSAPYGNPNDLSPSPSDTTNPPRDDFGGASPFEGAGVELQGIEPTAAIIPANTSTGFNDSDHIQSADMKGPQLSGPSIPHTMEETETVVEVVSAESESGGISGGLGNEPNHFMPPVDLRPAAARQDFGSIPADRPNPYAFDREGYRWMRGTVRFDQQAGKWVLQYTGSEGPQDELGGTIALNGHEHLKMLQPDDVILVEGHIDPQNPDAMGKPTYQVVNVARLVPRQ